MINTYGYDIACNYFVKKLIFQNAKIYAPLPSSYIIILVIIYHITLIILDGK